MSVSMPMTRQLRHGSMEIRYLTAHFLELIDSGSISYDLTPEWFPALTERQSVFTAPELIVDARDAVF